MHDLIPRTPREIFAECQRYGIGVITRDYKCGAWELDYGSMELAFRHPNGSTYAIPIEEFTNSNRLVDWIFQVQGKKWATRSTMSCLIKALDDLLDPQNNLAHSTEEFDPVAHIRRITRPSAKSK
jgi:hypothetical protein